MPIILESSLSRTLLSRCERTPDLVAFSSRKDGAWVNTTYAELLQKTLVLAAYLRSRGVREGSPVAIISETTEEVALLQWALWALRAIAVPLSPQLNSEELRRVLADSTAHVVFFQDTATAERAGLEPGAILSLRDMGAWLEEGRAEAARIGTEELKASLWDSDPGAPFLIIYTSGTLGEPKGVMLSQANVMSGLEDAADVLRTEIEPDNDTRLMVLPLAHFFGQFELASALVFGSKVCFSERNNRLAEELQETQPTVLFGGPKLFEKILTMVRASLESRPTGERRIIEHMLEASRRVVESRENLQKPTLADTAESLLARQTVGRAVQKQLGGRLKFGISGGAPLSPEVARELELLGLRILEGYGLTETSGPITIHSPAEASRDSLAGSAAGSVGRPLAQAELRFSSDGEILVKSPKNFLGYWKRPAETSSALREGWLHTGDQGFLDSGGRLHITGRKKELIRLSTGQSISPQKIENLARNRPFIEDCIVLGDGRPHLAALVTVKREGLLKFCSEKQILFSSFKDLVEHPKVLALIQSELESLNEELPAHEKIRRFVILPESLTVYAGVMTHTHKPRRHEIAERYKEQIDALYPQSTPEA